MAIYLDNAATTPTDQSVVEAMLPFLQTRFGNPSAIHSIGREIRSHIEAARKSVAQHINASTAEIFFTSGGTEANNTALMGAVRDLGVTDIITCSTEHHCILHYIEYLQKYHHVKIHFVKNCGEGHVDFDNLKEILGSIKGKKLVSLMHANNEVGTMLDLDQLSVICQEYGAYLHSDTVQTFAHFEIDVQKTPINFLSCSAHKFHGPKGSGFIYIKGDNPISPLLYGGSQERNMRAGTENVVGIIGLQKAAEVAYQHLGEHREYIVSLKEYLRAQLIEHIEDVKFNGNQSGASLYTVLSTSFPKSAKSELLLLHLDIEGICASGGSACSSGVDIGSHVLKAMNADPHRSNVRFSFSKYNTKEEIDILISKLVKILYN